jgi:very-short-patch-repair endonuclease
MVINGNRLRLMWKLWENLPPKFEGLSSGSDMGVLLGELSKHKKIMPIRKLMTQAGHLIQKIKPCFMMGPLSVAQFLDPKIIKFDVIIFDEASQVKPQDALGALLRGNQAVVIGDSRQLPPTSFFDNMIESDPDTDDTTDMLSSNFQSILDFCNKFPKRDLRWHYRSRHESLIALSNAKFYDNRLFVYPSPSKDTKELGLKFVYLPNCPYEGGSINRGEAKAVAKAVIDHLRTNPEKSIGVGAFNIKQQQAINDEIEVLLGDNPDLQQYFMKDRFEYCFIKNLETIQGDERDVIFISIGFGKKNKETILQKHFGPLNQDGGERRLNVLMTRARRQCVVFCNFTHRDLPVSDDSPVGVKILKLFLEYAETGILPTSITSGGTIESPFEQSVYDYLVDHGHQVETQVGCAGFRIDLAVIDPAEPGRFLLGIECDGAQYHSSKVARDRDRLRQKILEELKWKIYRVWSTDWYREPEPTKRKLLHAIDSAKMVRDTPSTNTFNNKKFIFEKQSEIQISPKTIDKIAIKNTVNSTLPVYRTCTKINLDSFDDFDEIPNHQLIDAIIDIVEIESPIHIEEVVNRIQDLANIKRMGSKIRLRIEDACEYAVSTNRVRRVRHHLWKDRTHSLSILRQRLPEHSKDIEYICDEEIMDAIKYVLETQFATPQEDIVAQISKIFYINSTKKVTEKFIAIIQKLIQMDQLEILPNQKIFFKKQ